METAWWILMAAGIVLTALSVRQGVRAGDDRPKIFDEALSNIFVSVLAVSFLAPWRWAQIAALVAAGLICLRRFWVLRIFRRQAG